MSPLVSIIIPAHNSEKWLMQTLRSALDQTWPHIEIIVIDDGSTDGTLQIAQGFLSDKVKVYTQENRGPAAARNRGLLAAGGDFIEFLDADDLLDRRKIEVQVKRLQQEGSYCVASGSWAMFSASIDGVTFSPEPLWCDMDPVDWVCALFTRKGMMPIHSWLVPRQIATKAGLWDESLTLNDDREYFTRVVLASQGVLYCKDATSYYRTAGQDSLSRCRTRAAWESACKVSELNVAHLLAVKDTAFVRSACATELAGVAITAYEHNRDLAARAMDKIRALDVAEFQLPFGGMYGIAAKTIGWENALKIKHTIKSLWK